MWVVMDDAMELNDVVLDDTLLLSPPPSSPSLGPDPFSIGSEPWVIAEKATDEIIGQIQPTFASQERRRKVIDYVQQLLKSRIRCEVFPFGSVPLKTYLPDGDIDLTAFSSFVSEDSLANIVSSILEDEGQNPSAECRVKDVQYIRAEVKLVKCLVQNIVVDISFNQLGGLCTLCFLEQVDRLIGKNQLFKRSIILIKAWCYYESRILGAHHGLISTYALETLVLYIFHLFHSSLDGPLAVLYKFLDYFSKFDWKNLCVSLSGPIPISSLPESVKGVVEPENSGSDLLLSDDFLKECLEKFSVPARGAEASSRTFHRKHLNIVDPLREDNNLGRSISEGNFYRIRSAFSYGARKLGQILRRPNDDIAGEVCKFFTNTLNRHGKGLRPDVQDPLPVPPSDFAPGLLLSAAELAHEDWSLPESEYINSAVRYNEGNAASQELQDVVNAFAGTGMDLDHRTSNWQHGGLQKSAFAEAEKGKVDICVSVARLSGDAEDMATTGARTRVTNGLHSPNGSKSLVNDVHHAPHLYYPRTLPNGKIEGSHQDDKKPENSRHLGAGESCEQEIMHSHGNHEPVEAGEKTSSSALTQESFCTEDLQSSCSSSSCSSDRLSSEAVGCREASTRLPDLSGDFDNNLENLRNARMWSDHASLQAMHQRVSGKSPWDPMQFPLHMPPNMFPHQVNPNGVMPRPPPFFHTPPMVPGPFSVEELPRPRGTGTYFPNPSHYSYRERHSPGRGRVQVPLKSPRGNGRDATFSDKSLHRKNSNRDQSVQTLPQSPGPSPRGKSFRKDANGFIEPSERGEGPVSVRQPPPEAAAPEGGQQPSSMTAVVTEGPPAMTDNKLAVQMYRLKDEEDFPPLSS